MRTLLAAACVALALAAGPASAQADYPQKPVRILVGANAGGGTDVIARMLAEKFAESLKQPFVVENRPGASNTIAADLTAKAPADGYTLLVATNTGQAIAPHLLKLSYDPLKQLQPVGLVVVVPNVLVVGDKVPAKDVKELVAMAKAKPGELRYASSGVGSTQHIAGEAFDQAAGVKMIHVPYKGSSQAHVDILGGNVEVMFDTTSSAMPHIKSGRFKPLAVTSPQRSPELPNVPTIAEVRLSGRGDDHLVRPVRHRRDAEARRRPARRRAEARARAAGRAGQAQGAGRGARQPHGRAVRRDEPAGIRALRQADPYREHQGRVMAAPRRPRIALTLGDPNGIGPEIGVKLAARPENGARADIVLFSDPAIVEAGERVAAVTLAWAKPARRGSRRSISSPRATSSPARRRAREGTPRCARSTPPSPRRRER